MQLFLFDIFMNFSDLGLSDVLLQAIAKKGYTAPSPIQAQVIPLFLKTKGNVLGQAQTGTGKTAAFGLPLLDLVNPKQRNCQALILAPTRELAIQVATEIESFAVPNSPSIGLLYGGNDMKKELYELGRNPNIIVGTPGRVFHHIKKRSLDLSFLKYFVLDEADEMLNFGFREEIEDIWKNTPEDKQVLLFSATIPPSILEMVRTYMPSYEQVKIEAKTMTNENITQKLYCIGNVHKFDALCRVMDMSDDFYAIVFCRTKFETDLVASQLMAHHFHAEAIHGDIDQSQREKVLGRFKQGKTRILVATDVAARGIDVENLTFVVNYSLPESYESYTHRIGRTGRAGKKGTSVTFVSRSEMSRVRFFESKLGSKMERASLPTAEEIIENKQLHLLQEVHTHLTNAEHVHLKPLAQHLIKLGSPEDIIAALLSVNYAEDFDKRAYGYIDDSFPEERRDWGSRSYRSDDSRNRGQRNQHFARNRTSGGGRDSGGRSSYGGGSRGGSRGGRDDRGGRR